MHTRLDPEDPTRKPLLRIMLLALLVSAVMGIMASGCSDPSSPEDPVPYPVAWSWTDSDGLTVSLRYLMPISAPDCNVDSVTVTGPGLASPLQLTCTGAKGVSFTEDVDVSLAPPSVPAVYTFRATIDGKTANQTAEVNCYMPLPAGTAPAPGASVASPVTLRWTLGAGAGIEYTISVFRAGVQQAEGTVTDQNSMAFSLAPGSYQWAVWAEPKRLGDGTSSQHCGADWDAGAFSVN